MDLTSDIWLTSVVCLLAVEAFPFGDCSPQGLFYAALHRQVLGTRTNLQPGSLLLVWFKGSVMLAMQPGRMQIIADKITHEGHSR